jgi:hypothetical protein
MSGTLSEIGKILSRYWEARENVWVYPVHYPIRRNQVCVTLRFYYTYWEQPLSREELSAALDMEITRCDNLIAFLVMQGNGLPEHFQAYFSN